MTCPGPMHPNGTMEPETCVPHGQHCPVPCGGPMGMPCPGYGSPSPASTTATMTTTMLWGAKCAPMEVECPGHLLPDATFGPSTCMPMGMPCPGYGAPSPASSTTTTTTMLWGAKCAPMEVECP